MRGPVGEYDQKFATFDALSSTGIAGTGIGLFMARTLARMQGGDLALHPGNGKTTFRLTLPTFDGDVS